MSDSFQRKLQPRLQSIETTEMVAPSKTPEKRMEEVPARQELQPKVLSSLMVSLKLQEKQGSLPYSRNEPQAKLMKLLQSPSVQAILEAAGIFSRNSGQSPEEALKQILTTLKDIDRTWEQILVTEGVARLSTPSH